MSQGFRQHELQEKTQKLLQGPLKHVRAAALAAALLPLASVAATPAAAQNVCPSAGVCGVVWNDTNNNGMQEPSETGIPLAKVTVSDGIDTIDLETGPYGEYSFFVSGGVTVTISVLIPTLAQPSPSDFIAAGDTLDSDGIPVGAFSAVTFAVTGYATDFGFYTALVSAQAPGTGTPGYWKNHPEAWPVQEIIVGGIKYTKAQAITLLGKVGKDKSITMFSSLLSALLNQKIGNEDICVIGAIADAQTWMTAHSAGSGVAGSSAAWAGGEPTHMMLDAYNNGLLCAKHRN
jgi:hypothetical protein